jgi:diketogulonate reductase-like aldo/keto reductase
MVDRIVGTALDAGINIIDTADVYAAGASERLIGQSLRNLSVIRSRRPSCRRKVWRLSHLRWRAIVRIASSVRLTEVLLPDIALAIVAPAKRRRRMFYRGFWLSSSHTMNNQQN